MTRCITQTVCLHICFFPSIPLSFHPTFYFIAFWEIILEFSSFCSQIARLSSSLNVRGRKKMQNYMDLFHCNVTFYSFLLMVNLIFLCPASDSGLYVSMNSQNGAIVSGFWGVLLTMLLHWVDILSMLMSFSCFVLITGSNLACFAFCGIRYDWTLIPTLHNLLFIMMILINVLVFMGSSLWVGLECCYNLPVKSQLLSDSVMTLKSYVCLYLCLYYWTPLCPY